MHIEEALPEDAGEILALQKAAYRVEAERYDDFDIPPMLQTLGEMSEDIEAKLVLKAVIDGHIVGSVRAWMKGDTCYIGRLIVGPEMQDRGIGTALMEEVERRFGGTGRFVLFTGHRSDKNLHLYGKLGYKSYKTKPVHDGLTLIFLEKRVAAEE